MSRRGVDQGCMPLRGRCVYCPVGVRFSYGAVLLALCVWVSGCGYTGGKLLYFLGAGREPVIKAEFCLTKGPILILVDDFEERADRPAIKRYLLDELGEGLVKHKAAKRIVPHSKLDHLRQSDPAFDKRGSREVGELVGAEQVLWIEVRDVLAEEQFQDIISAAYFSASVKVINVLEKEKRTRVRLWPSSSEGHRVTASLPGDAVARLKTTDAICKELAKVLAIEITKLFCNHREDDFES
jgi:hypothetical protein